MLDIKEREESKLTSKFEAWKLMDNGLSIKNNNTLFSVGSVFSYFQFL